MDFLLHTGILILCLLGQRQIHSKEADHVHDSLIKEIERSWHEYNKRAVNLKGKFEGQFFLDDELYIHDETILFHGKDSYASMSRGISIKLYSSDVLSTVPRASVRLVRDKPTFCEYFHIVNTKPLAEIRSIDELNVPQSKYWALQDERAISKENASIENTIKINLRKYSSLLGGFNIAPGLAIKLDEMLRDPEYTVKIVHVTADACEISYTHNIDEPNTGIARGTIQLRKLEGIWLVSSSMTYYGKAAIMFKGMNADEGSNVVGYSKILENENYYPTEIVQTTTLHDKDNVKHVTKLVTKGKFEKMADSSPFSLTYYGIPERILKEPVLVTNGVIPLSPDSSTVEAIPVWGWLAGGGMVCFIVGLLLLMTRPKKKLSA